MRIKFEDVLIKDNDILLYSIQFLTELTQVRSFRGDTGYGLSNYDEDFLVNYYQDCIEDKKISERRRYVATQIVMKYYKQLIYFSNNKEVFDELQRSAII